MTGIADTGFIVAFLNRDDQYHSWAVSLSRRITAPLLTCEPVLAEAAFKVSSVPIVLGLIHSQFLRLAFSLEENLSHIAGLAIRYKDRSPDLADLCLIRMSEMHPKHEIFTVDSDFTIYRRNKRDSIPLILPPRN